MVSEEAALRERQIRRAARAKRNRLLLQRVATVFLIVLNAHSQTLFTACDAKTRCDAEDYKRTEAYGCLRSSPVRRDTQLVVASVGIILGLMLVLSVFTYVSRKALGQQLGPNAVRRKAAFSFFLALCLSADVAGLILTVILAKRLEWDGFELVSNLLPALRTPSLASCTRHDTCHTHSRSARSVYLEHMSQRQHMSSDAIPSALKSVCLR